MAPYIHKLSVVLAGSSTASTSKLTSLDDTYGALFIGTGLALMLYGSSVHQMYRYFRMYPDDARWLFWVVIAISVLDTFHTIVVISACYNYLVTNYMNPTAMSVVQWSSSIFAPTVGLIILVCQSFYVHRVWMIGRKHRYPVYIAVVFMLIFLGFTIAATVEGCSLGLSEFSQASWLISAMFGTSTFVDALLTGTLITVLVRGRTGFERTDSIIEVLIIYAINTGLLTSVTAVLGFIFGLVLSGTFIYIGISIVGAKLYTNSVLAVLNSRRSLADKAIAPGGLAVASFEVGAKKPKLHNPVAPWDVSEPQAMMAKSTHLEVVKNHNAEHGIIIVVDRSKREDLRL